eukprot:3774108-Pleurochrysis_carterae.AAC.3
MARAAPWKNATQASTRVKTAGPCQKDRRAGKQHFSCKLDEIVKPVHILPFAAFAACIVDDARKDLASTVNRKVRRLRTQCFTQEHRSIFSISHAVLRQVSHAEPRQPRTHLGVLGQMLAAKMDNVLVDVNHHAPLHRRMAQDFARSRPLAAAADVDGLWVWVRQQRWVHQAFMVDEFVRLGRLNEAVDH